MTTSLILLTAGLTILGALGVGHEVRMAIRRLRSLRQTGDHSPVKATIITFGPALLVLAMCAALVAALWTNHLP